MNTDDFHTRYAEELAGIGPGSCSATGYAAELARRLQRMALEYEEEDDDKNAVDCSSAAQEIRDCALDIEEALAGKKPNDQAQGPLTKDYE